ncbi:MAG: DNA mismatch endonuclease Vsr [Spirochaetaceae bacterium]|nr:MAG: DNA mismatch endonuclease Vsr [Spirochaetaceae bacterium]
MDVFPEKKRREIMSRVKNRSTRQELFVRSLLHRLGYRFRLHRSDLPGTPDIVLPKYSTVVFVNGCFWHGHDCPRGKLPESNKDFWAEKIEKNRNRDQQNIETLESLGWQVVVVWTCETASAVKLTALGHRLAEAIGRHRVKGVQTKTRTTIRRR